MMVGCVSYNGNTVFIDSAGEKHIFTENETRFLQTLLYKWVQKRGEGVWMRC